MTTKKATAGEAGLPPDVWRRLHEVAARVRALEPWLWMEESDIFGVLDTQSHQVLYVSVMGMLGEHFAVAVYPGATELARQQALADYSLDERTDLFFDIRHAQVAFDKKSALYPEEQAAVKRLGLSHKGGHAWPSFQSFKPGYFPWVADAEEARWLLLAMEQLLLIAPRIARDQVVLRAPMAEQALLVRLPDAAAPDGWREEYRPCAPPTHRLQAHVPPELFGAVRFLAQQELHIEMDVYPWPIAIGEPGVRPQMPYTLLLVEPASGFTLGFELLDMPASLEEMWLDVPAKLLQVLAKNGLRPTAITVPRAWLGAVLQPLCADLDIALHSGPLSVLPRIRQEMEKMTKKR